MSPPQPLTAAKSLHELMMLLALNGQYQACRIATLAQAGAKAAATETRHGRAASGDSMRSTKVRPARATPRPPQKSRQSALTPSGNPTSGPDSCHPAPAARHHISRRFANPSPIESNGNFVSYRFSNQYWTPEHPAPRHEEPEGDPQVTASIAGQGASPVRPARGRQAARGGGWLSRPPGASPRPQAADWSPCDRCSRAHWHDSTSMTRADHHARAKPVNPQGWPAQRTPHGRD